MEEKEIGKAVGKGNGAEDRQQTGHGTVAEPEAAKRGVEADKGKLKDGEKMVLGELTGVVVET